MFTQPNFFKCATSELSQDAFICYLSSWAKSEYASDPMHEIGQGFIKALLLKHEITCDKITNVEIHRQCKNIDVLLSIETKDKKYAILIEDKTYTKEDSEQLTSYYNTIEKDSDFADHEILGIYFKIGSQAENYIISDKFKMFLRKDILQFLNSYSTTNTIFNDFKEYLQKYDDALNTWKTLPIQEWYYHTWEGFYEYLSSQINNFNYSYVSNPSGGFLGAFWFFIPWRDAEVYLQIEEGLFTFKVFSTTKDKEYRNKWQQLLLENAHTLGIEEIQKPQQFGSGTHMTACVITCEDWLGKDNATININDILARLKKYEELTTLCSKK